MFKKQIFWKNIVGTIVLFGVILLIFIFDVKIGFSIFENINLIHLNCMKVLVLVILIIIFVIIIVILYIKIKNRKEIDE